MQGAVLRDPAFIPVEMLDHLLNASCPLTKDVITSVLRHNKGGGKPMAPIRTRKFCLPQKGSGSRRTIQRRSGPRPNVMMRWWKRGGSFYGRQSLRDH